MPTLRPAELRPAKIEGDTAKNFDIQVERTVLAFLNDLGYLMAVDSGDVTGSINRLIDDFSKTSNGQIGALKDIGYIVKTWNKRLSK